MNKRLFASIIVRAEGVLLLVIAVIHLAVTPLLREAVLDRVLAPELLPVVAPPFLLNHLVVGVLLLPLGFITIYSAAGICSGERWAGVITFSIGLAMVSLPVLLLALMRGEQFQALPFRIAELLVTVVAVTMPTVLIWARSECWSAKANWRAGTEDVQ